MPITPMPNLDFLLAMPTPEAVRIIQDHPAWSWTVAHAITAGWNGLNQIAINGGMGLPNGLMILPNGVSATEKFVRLWKLAAATPVATWRGFDFRRLEGKEYFMGQIDAMAALDTGTQYLTESALQFILSRDQGRKLGVFLINHELSQKGIQSLFEYDEEATRLTWDFRNQMVAEAEPQRYQVAAGAYILAHTNLRAVDSEMAWDAVRLVIHPRGIFAGFLFEDVVMPMFWTPEGTNTSQVYVHPRAVFALDAMLACIWRDACVVREHWSERYASKQIKTSPASQEDQGKVTRAKALILPRTVYRVSWATEPERRAIEHTAHAAHAVTACYPRLEEGKVYAGAAERAEEHGWPAPPPGRTFRKPHTRGEGAVADEQHVRIVCKGLQIANMVLN